MNRCHRVTRLLQLIIVLALLSITSNVTAGAAIVYSSDFETEPDAAWTNRRSEQAPSGPRFLGRFSNQTVGLGLKDLPPHGALRVAFDLYVILSWDGTVVTTGPDIFDLRVAGGLVLLHTTFSNVQFSQTYPEHFPGFTYGARTRSVANNTLGYLFDAAPMDSIYRIVITFPHTDPTVRLDFSAAGLEGLDNESWGLDNVSVEALPSLGEERVVNGDMEMPDVPGDLVAYGAGESFGGWSVSSGTVDHMAGYAVAASGKQSVDLTGESRGSIIQSVPTEPGRRYKLRFAMAGHPLGLEGGAAAVKRMQVTWAGALVTTASFDVKDRKTYDMGWRYHEYEVVGPQNKTSADLRFVSLAEGFFGPTVDMVSVVPLPAPGRL